MTVMRITTGMWIRIGLATFGVVLSVSRAHRERNQSRINQ